MPSLVWIVAMLGLIEDGRDAFLAERLDGLGTGVVELARLAYFEAAGAEDQHALDVAHRASPVARPDSRARPTSRTSAGA